MGTLLLGMSSLQIVLPVFIFFAVLVVRQQQWNEIIADCDNNEHFEQIKIAAAEAPADYTAGGEFMYHGVLYDIHSVTKENGNYVITALADKPETQLQQVNAGNIEGTHGINTQEIKVLPFFFLYYEQHVAWQLSAVYFNNIFSVYHERSFPEHIVSIMAPPPRSGNTYIVFA